MSVRPRFLNRMRPPEAPPSWLADLVQGVRHRLMAVHRRVVPPQVALVELASSHWLARAIGVAAQLDIATRLKPGPQSVEQLAEATQAHAPSLRRLLRALASEGIFKEMSDGRFRLTPMAAAMADGENSLKHLVLLNTCDFNWTLFQRLDTCVKTGEDAVTHLHGQEPFDHIRSDAKLSEMFNLAMADASRLASAPIAGAFDFRPFRLLVDVGGCSGLLLANILKRNPGGRGIVLDHPNLEGEANAIFAEYGIADRCAFLGGDFFESVPTHGDGYLLKNILHDWDDDRCHAILENLLRAMPADATLLIVEAVVQNGNRPDFGKMMDLQMLTGTGGRERTKKDFAALLTTAGFDLKRVVRTATPFSILECKKRAGA